MCNAGDVLGHGSNKTSEADQMDILMSVTRDNLKRCIEGDIDGINEIDSKAFSASVKLDCYIQCNKTGNRPVPVCRMCWTKANHFTKYMMDNAASKIKKSGSDRPNPNNVNDYDDSTYHDLSHQQTMDSFLAVEGVGQYQGS